MSRKNRSFDTSFKLEVVKMIKDHGMTASEVCRDVKLAILLYGAGFNNTKQSRWGARELQALDC